MNRQYKFIIGIAVIVVTVGFLVYSAVDQTKMYMVTVAEYLSATDAYSGTTVRIAGRVRDQSMRWDATSRELDFVLDDIESDGSVAVHYTGLLPDMFAEGRDVVVEGPHRDDEVFEASSVLTSCPSKYEPQAEAAPE
jgi:cytochrome c-type biogenesis protein CcmE